ncbi:hypothetical protein FISHEDRAFT_69436 [Fistulina hepatica ATCC 64428]|uniref:Uncharacterized protein n=1 Tax=Fistulina hepatica ATCC 64428 TaxID=1128425 RepID=A0A0D7AMK3_9AGAR|nr:hypothetical protein FISHEDRAFT_69436 [Fistulina hepatica ATCC 64428]
MSGSTNASTSFTTLTSSTPPPARTDKEEFERFLEALWQYKARKAARSQDQHGKDAIQDKDSAPSDVEPLFERLAAIVDCPQDLTESEDQPDAPANATLPPVEGPRPRRITLATSGSSESAIEVQKATNTLLPAGKEYKFRFKKMIHTVYESSHWKKVVEQALEESRRRFRSNLEIAEEQERREVDKPQQRRPAAGDGGIHFDIDFSHRSSHSRRPSVANSVYPRSPRSPRSPWSATFGLTENGPLESVRVLKKRCVGRDKIMENDGPLEKGTWFYEAEVSRAHRDDVNTLPRRKRYISLGGLGRQPLADVGGYVSQTSNLESLKTDTGTAYRPNGPAGRRLRSASVAVAGAA